MMTNAEILEKLPYEHPFLFVDELENFDNQCITGKYTFRSESWFYQGHFKNFPITPGVILTECCAQIGLVCLGIYLLGDKLTSTPQIALTETDMEFLRPVYPSETVRVLSEKVYFRFQKLKCKVKMLNKKNQVVCRGMISGMLKVKEDGE